MNCERVDELLAAYVLDAVDDDERAAVEAHLAGCERHKEAVELRAVMRALAELAPEREPSPALEARVLEAANAPQRRTGVRRLRPLRLAWGWPAVAAALAVLVVGLAVWNLVLLGGDVLGGAETPALVHVYREGESWMRVETEAGAPELTVALGGLAPRPDSEAFQLWAIREDRWLSIGTFNTNAEARWQGEFAFSLQRTDAVALTVEPAGGSERPTGTRVFEPPR